MESMTQQEAELAQREQAIIEEKAALYDAMQRRREAAFATAVVEAERDFEEQSQACEADDAQRFARLNLPELHSVAAYQTLPDRAKSEYLRYFGAEYPAQLRRFEASGLKTWAEFEQLYLPELGLRKREAKPRPNRTHFRASNGVELVWNSAHGKWQPTSPLG